MRRHLEDKFTTWTVCYPSKTVYRQMLRPGVYARNFADMKGFEGQQIVNILDQFGSTHQMQPVCDLKGAAPALFGAE